MSEKSMTNKEIALELLRLAPARVERLASYVPESHSAEEKNKHCIGVLSDIYLGVLERLDERDRQKPPRNP